MNYSSPLLSGFVNAINIEKHHDVDKYSKYSEEEQYYYKMGALITSSALLTFSVSYYNVALHNIFIPDTLSFDRIERFVETLAVGLSFTRSLQIITDIYTDFKYIKNENDDDILPFIPLKIFDDHSPSYSEDKNIDDSEVKPMGLSEDFDQVEL